MEPIENLFRLLAQVQQRLEQAGIPSMVYGGIAVIAWGRTRFTEDVDLKILATRDDAAHLIALMAPEYQPVDQDPETKLRQLGFVFFRDPSQIRIDLVLAETSFDLRAMERAKSVEMLPGLSLNVCTPEDLLVYKMISTRARDNDDVPGIIRRQKKQLDDKYIEHWLREFEIALDDSTLIQSYRKMRQTIA